jgi:acetylornithine deacetylase/succinyl-diaminopimelate desuccinylase-like protein
MDLLVNEAGIPGALFGPGSIAAAHKPNESVAVDEVIAFTKAVALAVYGWCA